MVITVITDGLHLAALCRPKASGTGGVENDSGDEGEGGRARHRSVDKGRGRVKDEDQCGSAERNVSERLCEQLDSQSSARVGCRQRT